MGEQRNPLRYLPRGAAPCALVCLVAALMFVRNGRADAQAGTTAPPAMVVSAGPISPGGDNTITLLRNTPSVIRITNAVGDVSWPDAPTCVPAAGNTPFVTKQSSQDGTLFTLQATDAAPEAECFLEGTDHATPVGRHVDLVIFIGPSDLATVSKPYVLSVYPDASASAPYAQYLVHWLAERKINAVVGAGAFSDALLKSEQNCVTQHTIPLLLDVLAVQKPRPLTGFTRTDVTVMATRYDCEARVSGSFYGINSEKEPTNLGGALFKYVGLLVALKPGINSVALTTSGPLATSFFDLSGNLPQIQTDTIDRALANLSVNYCNALTASQPEACTTPPPGKI